MAIQVSGVNVIDNQRNLNVGILTATSVDVPPQAISFSPADGTSDVAINSNIVITFNANVAKGSGNITLKEGDPSTGDVIQTIAVSSGSVSISGGAVTINPSDFPTGKDIYVVVDADAFTSSSLGSGTELINTYNFSTGPITTSSFSPADGATSQSISTNIVITFSENISKGSGNITLRAGSASGTIRQTIDVTSGAVSVSGNQATINPPSDLEYEEDTYVVVDAGCFRNSDGDASSGNAIINTYNFTTEVALPPLGSSYEGGHLICAASNIAWVVSPRYSEVRRSWWNRCHSITLANASYACGDWFFPTCSQTGNPGYLCREHWCCYCKHRHYWSDTDYQCNPTIHPIDAWRRMDDGSTSFAAKPGHQQVRAYRCVSY